MRFSTMCTAAGLAGMLLSLPAQATGNDEGAITGVKAVTSPRLELYARPALDSKVKELARESVKMPLEVFDVAEGGKLLKVKIDGDAVWVRKVQVEVAQTVHSGCLAQANAPQDGAANRNANRGC